jgi:N-acetylglucosamine kinase-like BadF-type ATPase
MKQPFGDPLVLAIDGGQSSTLALVARLDGTILGAGLAGPSNHVNEPGGLERLEIALRESTARALKRANLPAQNVIHVCMGMSGGPRQAYEIMSEIMPHAKILAHKDMVTALAGASIARPGVVVIAGTGSVAYGRLETGQEMYRGGWGYIMGDEGSAYDIGRNALRAACQANDGRMVIPFRVEPDPHPYYSAGNTRLVNDIPAHFGMKTLRDVHQAIYSTRISRPQIAGLAAVVTAAAQQGDEVARSILATAGQDLAKAALAVISALSREINGMDIYTTGGVFRAGPFVLDPFREMLQRYPVHSGAFSPVVGALFLALEAAHTVLTDDVIQAIRRSLPENAVSKHDSASEE